jgi:hypothetical protein
MTEFLLGIAIGAAIAWAVFNRAIVKTWIDSLRKKGP